MVLIMSTETIRFIRDGEKGGRGYEGVSVVGVGGRGRDYIPIGGWGYSC